jgi:hypothetical protein
MDKPDKSVEGVLAKVPANRRSFVQSILGLAGYSVPAVRSFIMASAVVPAAFSISITTTGVPTTTRNAWRPGRPSMEQPLSGSLIKPQSGSGSPGSLTGSSGSGSLIKPRQGGIGPNRKP